MVKPWYKQVWPWVLISIPFSVIIAMAITLTIASQYSGTPMVVDEYYKKGRAINAEVSKVVAAQDLGISFEFTQQNQQFLLRFNSGEPEALTALQVSFYHSTLAERDLEVQLTANANGVFRGELPDINSGKWTITIRPFDDSWRLSQSILLPTQEPIILKPQTYGV
ncbi:MAG: FixH family protein [Idiomarina sp.]